MRALAVHGGAGSAPRDPTPARSACERALAVGWAILDRGGSALDAVEQAVVALENEPVLNAGIGACLTETGIVELDASIMEGTTWRAGAVGAVRRIANPIRLARVLLEDGRHVFMVGEAAEELATAHGVALVENAALITPQRAASWREREATGDAQSARDRSTPPDDANGRGTVGAVAVDAYGHVAAATSTGGTAWKRVGRIGDSAVIGAGTFADDRGGAVSSTGNGEAIMRATLARAIVDQLRRGIAPEQAARAALADVTATGGDAGVIVVDRFGRIAAVHTSPHMTYALRGE